MNVELYLNNLLADMIDTDKFTYKWIEYKNKRGEAVIRLKKILINKKEL